MDSTAEGVYHHEVITYHVALSGVEGQTYGSLLESHIQQMVCFLGVLGLRFLWLILLLPFRSLTHYII